MVPKLLRRASFAFVLAGAVLIAALTSLPGPGASADDDCLVRRDSREECVRPNIGGAVGALGAAAGAAERNRERAAQAANACAPITAVNAASLSQVSQVNVGDGKQLRWAKNGQSFFAVGLNEVSRYDAATLQKTTLYSGTANVLDFNPDSGLAAIQSGQTTFLLRDLFQQQDKGTVTASGQYRTAQISPDSSLVAVSLLSELATETRRTSDGAFVRKYTGLLTGSPVFAASFSPDGQSLVWLARALVQLSDLATGTFGPRFEHEDFVLALSIAAGRLATAFGGGLRLWDLAAGAKLADFTLANGVFQAVLNHDAGLVFGGNKSDIGVWDTTSKALVADIVKPGTLLALSPNECVLLGGTFDGIVSVLTVQAGAPSTGSGTGVRPPNTGDAGLLVR
jgi:WD40 repeat protein